MEQIILMAGTILAAAIGCALVGLVLVRAVGNSRNAVRSKDIRSTLFVEESNAFKLLGSEPPLRGYDSPELHRDDAQKRLGDLSEAHRWH